MKLRPYQQEAVTRTAKVFGTSSSALVVMATGVGKTVCLAHIIKNTPGRAMVVAHREELISQAANKIQAITGMEPDIEMAGNFANRLHKADTVVATVQTLSRGRIQDFDPTEFSLLVIDEAHHATARTYQAVIKHFQQNPDCNVLGVTATPDRADEAALGQIFEDVAYEYGICDCIADGWLVPVMQNQVFVQGLDFSGIRTRMGDLAENELAQILEFEENLHGIVGPTMEIAKDRKTLVFTASVAQAERLAEIFNRYKPGSANYVTGKTPRETRRGIFSDYAAGRFQYLCNVGVATEGFDEPGVEVVVMARPTKSRCLYAQMAGRGTRPAEEIAHELNDMADAEQRRAMIAGSVKPSVQIIDFVGNAGRHKLVNSADILGGKYPDDIIDMAKRTVAQKSKAGEPVEMLSELQRCEHELARRRRMAAEAKMRAGIKLYAKFAVEGVSPFDVMDIVPQRVSPCYRDREPSKKMMAFLERRNIDATKMNFVHAGQLISELKKCEESESCTPKQSRLLARYGIDTADLTKRKASTLIDQIAKNGWRLPEGLKNVG